MKTEVKKLWLDALRSGEYTQTTGELKNSEGYCCLGVLCDIAVKNGVITEIEDGYLSQRDVADSNYIENATLPIEVMYWAELDSVNPTITLDEYCCDSCNNNIAYDLSELNDNKNWSFVQISEVIEEQL